MTSVPKPLKFLRPHYQHLKQTFEQWSNENPNKWELADILSVLAMTQTPPTPAQQAAAQKASEEGEIATTPAFIERESLKFKQLSRELYAKSGSKSAAATASAPSATSTSSTTTPATETESAGSVGSWGHEYVRNLAGEIGKEFLVRQEANASTNDLESLVDEILPFFMKHNADFDAIDLLIETEMLHKLSSYVNKDNVQRINLYIVRCADYVATTEEKFTLLKLAYDNYFATQQWSDALRVAMKLQSGSMPSGGDEDAPAEDLIAKIFDHETVAEDLPLQKQLGFMLGSLKIVPECLREREEIMEAVGNVNQSTYFAQLAQDLDVKEAKTPEDIYKTHLEEGGSGRRGVKPPAATTTATVDSAKQNLSSTFVNAFLNAGFGKDLLLTPEGSDWLYKNKGHGMLSATASLGMLMLWDVESGFSSVDRYSFSTQTHIKAGAALAHGILSSGITSEMDAAQALLSEHLESKDPDMKMAAIFGLGLAYAGTGREDVLELLVPLIVDSSQTMEVVSHACLSLGLVYQGTANDDIAASIVEAFMDRSETDLNDSTARLMCLGIGLLFLGTNENCEGILLALQAIEHPIKAYLLLTVETCAYAGSNSVLVIQKLLNNLTEHISSEEEEKEPNKLIGLHQEIAVLGISLVAMGEELSQEMALRSLDHVLQYGEVNVRRVVPLALGLISIANPRLTIMDTLSKLSHDSDERVSQNAIFAMGLIGAGTNNSRLATLLRQLATYYSKEPNHLFLVRIAQGLLHMGKGLLTINPLQSDQMLINKVSLSGILIVMHAALDMKNTLLSSKRHYLLFSLATAIRPRWLITLDGDSDDLKPIAISVRVGSRVDPVGLAGKGKTITGFQTHKTPVLLAANDRAELGTDEYIALTRTLEGVVIIKKNPNYKPPQ